jgi:hypothetical protein
MPANDTPAEPDIARRPAGAGIATMIVAPPGARPSLVGLAGQR